MAFPTTGILDNFNTGASQNLRSATRAGWASQGVWNFNGALATDAVPTNAVNSGADAAWGTSFAADQEVFVTYGAWSNTQAQSIFARLQALNTGAGTYYRLTRTSGTNDWFIMRAIAGVETGVASGFTQAVASGDSMGLECIGSTISAYYRSGAGAWVQKTTGTDTGVTGGGFIGIDNYTTLVSYDAFGGGNVVTGSSSHFLSTLGAGT